MVVVSRPVARMLQDGHTAEVTRLCTNGYPNACSKLYAAAAKATLALGYRRLVTYTLAERPAQLDGRRPIPHHERDCDGSDRIGKPNLWPPSART